MRAVPAQMWAVPAQRDVGVPGARRYDIGDRLYIDGENVIVEVRPLRRYSGVLRGTYR
jgi:hypothetical protein